MDTRNTNERSEIAGARRPGVDWSALTTGERIRYLELEGYLVLPDLLQPEQMSAIGAELAALPLTATDYSPHKKATDDLLGHDLPQTLETIALPSAIAFLERLFGTRCCSPPSATSSASPATLASPSTPTPSRTARASSAAWPARRC